MDRHWRQGLGVSLLIHALILGVGGLWGRVRQPDPPESPPVRARLVVPQSEPVQPKQEVEIAPRSEQSPDAETSETLQASQPREAAAKARVADSGAAARPEPAASAGAPKPPEAQVKAKPKEPSVKKPDQAVLKERVATGDASTPSQPAQSDQPEAKPEKGEKANAESRGKVESGQKTAQKKPSPDPGEPTQDSEPLLDESLTQKIARIAKEGRQGKQGSLKQQQAVARFQEAVRSRIQQGWLVPPGLANRSDLEATVRLALTPSGELAAPPRIVASNGPGHFNSSILRAVRKAAPFPMPEGPTQYFQNLELHFSPDMVQ